MQILTRDGYKDILDCSIGEEVKYYDTNTGEVGFNTIEVIEPKTAKNYPAEIETNDEDEDGNIIASIVPTNNDTNWYVVNDTYTYFGMQSVWSNLGVVHANQLSVGDIIYNDNNDDVEITSVSTYINEDKVWYRMAISGDSSFIADGLSLHNASRFWVGGTGNWDATTTHWSATSGGAGGASVPTSADDVYFTVLSSVAEAAYSVSCLSGAVCNSLDIDGPSTTDATKITFNTSGFLDIYGNINFSGGSAGITLSAGGSWALRMTTQKTFNSNGLTINGRLILYGNGGIILLNDLVTNSDLDYSSGIITPNGHSITMNLANNNNDHLQGGVSTLSFYNLIINGGAGTSSALRISRNITVTNSLTVLGNSSVNLFSFISNTPGTAKTITTTGATINIDNVRLQDITVSNGGVNWDLSNKKAVNLGNNTGITFPVIGLTGISSITGLSSITL